jgi:hypothetical protein
MTASTSIAPDAPESAVPPFASGKRLCVSLTLLSLGGLFWVWGTPWGYMLCFTCSSWATGVLERPAKRKKNAPFLPTTRREYIGALLTIALIVGILLFALFPSTIHFPSYHGPDIAAFDWLNKHPRYMVLVLIPFGYAVSIWRWLRLRKGQVA